MQSAVVTKAVHVDQNVARIRGGPVLPVQVEPVGRPQLPFFVLGDAHGVTSITGPSTSHPSGSATTWAALRVIDATRGMAGGTSSTLNPSSQALGPALRACSVA